MDLDLITLPKNEAEEQLREYRAALKQHDDEEYEAVARGLRFLKRGNVLGLIDLQQAIQAGGSDERGLPRLAVMRADMKICWLGNRTTDGAVTFQLASEVHPRRESGIYDFPAGTLPRMDQEGIRRMLGSFWWRAEWRTRVPLVPPSLRPRAHLRNYEILWEVEEWSRSEPRPPRDPALLKHVGGHLYAVLGVWDLTDLERSIIGRLS